MLFRDRRQERTYKKMTTIALNAQKPINPIYFKDFDKFKDITKNTTQAELLSRIYHFFKITKYKLEDGNKWFTRTREQLADMCKVSTRTIANYLRFFEQQGLIKRKNKLCNVKRLYITVTDKLLFLIGKSSSLLEQDCRIEEEKFSSSIYKVQKDNINTTTLSSNTSNTTLVTNESYNAKESCLFSEQSNSALSDYENYNPGTEELEQAEQARAELYNTPEIAPEPHSQTKKVNRGKVSDDIEKSLTDAQNRYVESTVKNLEKQIEITKPERLKEEITEAVTNPKRFSKARGFKHKINIIAKCIREGNWRAHLKFNQDTSEDPNTFTATHISREEDGTRIIDAAQPQSTQSTYSSEGFSDEDEAIWAEIDANIAERNRL